uniref:Uncharacterized protein n=1 Tax=Tetranychus urticae TaxID=32264 RepID=T1JX79_TETUR
MQFTVYPLNFTEKKPDLPLDYTLSICDCYLVYYFSTDLHARLTITLKFLYHHYQLSLRKNITDNLPEKQPNYQSYLTN